MAEDLQDEWWEEYRKKSSAEEDEADKNDNQLSKRQKKLNVLGQTDQIALKDRIRKKLNLTAERSIF